MISPSFKNTWGGSKINPELVKLTTILVKNVLLSEAEISINSEYVPAVMGIVLSRLNDI